MVNWDSYFIKIAEVASQRSKDPSSKVGAIIVDRRNRIISMGYNGFVSKCKESLMSLERPLKYNLTIHAEMNALLFAKQSVENNIIYVTHHPCDNCLKHLLQAGITEICYKDNSLMDRFNEYQMKAIELLIESTGIIVRQYEQ